MDEDTESSGSAVFLVLRLTSSIYIFEGYGIIEKNEKLRNYTTDDE